MVHEFWVTGCVYLQDARIHLQEVLLGVLPCLACSSTHVLACARAPVAVQEALLSAEIAMGCSIEPGVLEAATEELVESAEERNKKVGVAAAALLHFSCAHCQCCCPSALAYLLLIAVIADLSCT